MNTNYHDITDKLGEPIWWDESAVPRYVEFHPKECDVYIDQAVLLEIFCQACGRQFKVALVHNPHSLAAFLHGEDNPRLENLYLHFGDPPFHNTDCAAGSTMNSEPHRVLEWWDKDNFNWVRKPEQEGEIDERHHG